MKAVLRASAPVLVMALAACGTDPAPGPTEQIVVREPGAAADPVGAPDSGLIASGKAAFNSCLACHGIDEGGANKVGPNLHGIIGQAAGSVDGFAYSDALASSGITWTKEELDSYIANPAARVPGTTMMAGAITDAGRREAIIAYIEDVSAN
ncbi:c-type cytochrome [Parasphingorhabdus cellanae]|uniref:C-type cytochrome n=1 Tax=Parasphingorhabdus cellanae TaxID=2806553 RepID=A0ABX7T532_9SPHN|nr:c-type cytochrome [Parasphingorhabdus cellanae]QTD55093.1 c-type cytochrome [Parasphingorhabdus cellanae]